MLVVAAAVDAAVVAAVWSLAGSCYTQKKLPRIRRSHGYTYSLYKYIIYLVCMYSDVSRCKRKKIMENKDRGGGVRGRVGHAWDRVIVLQIGRVGWGG